MLIIIVGNFFNIVCVDYMEVLMMQCDVVELWMELIDMKQEQMSNWVDVYQVFGGGWN